jgi:hypothetical protein
MNSLSSLDEELTNEALLELAKEGTFIVLTTTDFGHRFRYEVPCHILKLEAPEPDAEEVDGRSWEHRQRLKIIMDCSPESLTRFVPDQEFKNVISKRITAQYDFASISEWIHTQTRGSWSLKLFADRRKRPKHSFLVFSFEDEQAAMLFKLFQI